MKSMTGYGYAEKTTENYSISLEVRSYNGRYFDINFNLPSFLGSYEQQLTEKIKQYTTRGRIELTVKTRQLEGAYALHVDHVVLKRYQEAYREIAKTLKLRDKPLLSDFLQAEGVILNQREDQKELFVDSLWEIFDDAMDLFDTSKRVEGKAMLVDLQQLGAQLEEGVVAIKGQAAQLEEILKANLIARFHELIAEHSYDENRLLQEVALLLNRYSIHEELIRLEAHITQYYALLASGENVGKRLDFLCQELNREINTIGSKSTMVEINQRVVVLKETLENIREQARNIE